MVLYGLGLASPPAAALISFRLGSEIFPSSLPAFRAIWPAEMALRVISGAIVCERWRRQAYRRNWRFHFQYAVAQVKLGKLAEPSRVGWARKILRVIEPVRDQVLCAAVSIALQASALRQLGQGSSPERHCPGFVSHRHGSAPPPR